MKRSLLALALLGLTGCSPEDKLVKRTEQQHSVQHYQPIDTQRLFYDVVNWAGDGSLDRNERIEILRACGYQIKTRCCWRGWASYIWNGKDWQWFENNIHDFPIGAKEVERFLLSYATKP